MAIKKKNTATDAVTQTATENGKATTKNSKTAKATAAKTSSEPDAGNTKERSQTELVRLLAERADVPQTKVKEVLEAHAQLLVEELQRAGSVQLYGVGKLKVGARAERQGRNPATGAAITIPASKTVKFAGGKAFKQKFQ